MIIKIKSEWIIDIPILFYLKLIDIIDRMRIVLFNPEQNISMDYLNKISFQQLKNPPESLKLNDDQEQMKNHLLICDYFSKKIKKMLWIAKIFRYLN